MEISQINEGLQKQCKQKLSNQCQYNKPTSKIFTKFKKKYVFHWVNSYGSRNDIEGNLMLKRRQQVWSYQKDLLLCHLNILGLCLSTASREHSLLPESQNPYLVDYSKSGTQPHHYYYDNKSFDYCCYHYD